MHPKSPNDATREVLGEVSDSASGPKELMERLKGISTTSYLTLMSIVQGAVLADLAGVVASHYAQFSLVQWLLVLPSFLLIIAAWNQVTMDALAWVQMQDMAASLIPFLVGACEFFLNHVLVVAPRIWLIGAALILTISSFAIRYVEQRVAYYPENAALLAHVQAYRQAGRHYNFGSSVVLLVVAGVGAVGLLTRFNGFVHQLSLIELIGGVAATLILLGFLARHIFYWRIVLAYARQQPTPKKSHGR
jgi:hypothetical protein